MTGTSIAAGGSPQTKDRASCRHVARPSRPYQPVDEVLSWSSTHNMLWPKLRRPALFGVVIAEKRLRQRAVRRDKVMDEEISVLSGIEPAVHVLAQFESGEHLLTHR